MIAQQSAMIITQLIGGLGNQMFQYAVGRAIAYRHNVPLKLDISEFAHYSLRTYRLNSFNIVEAFATQKELARFSPTRSQIWWWLVDRYKHRFQPYHKQLLLKERHLSFDPDILQVKKNAYLKGYWQSEKYFVDIADVIRQEFTLRHSPDRINPQLLTTINQVNSVSLHIRRGDYITNPATNKTHGFVGLDYYDQAVERIAQHVSNPEFFVFSDDINWAKKHLEISFPLHFMDHNGESQDHLDMWLMRHCKHHIVANSSFSWWGAWLSEFADKQVIAPRKWFAEIELDYASRFPPKWILL